MRTLGIARPNSFPILTRLAASSAAFAIMRQKRFPTAARECQFLERIITPLLTVTPFARHDDISGDVQSHAIAVHPVEVFDGRAVVFERAFAIGAASAEPVCHCFYVGRIADPDSKLRG